MDTVYFEQSIASHPQTLRLLERQSSARHIPIRRYTDVFNAAGQNFREQKAAPALILAEKIGKRVLPTPPGYGIGGTRNYYFAHMLNCVYDCRYCFLQGMYRSAHHVVFVNFDDFFDDIEATVAQSEQPSWFFSGYDCDSLALDPLTGFVDAMLDRLANMEKLRLELRTKSVQIRALLRRAADPRVVVAFSLSPEAIVSAEEHGTPSLERRLDALQRLQAHGWLVGLRFDPVIASSDALRLYAEFFDQVFDALDMSAVHSATLGSFRLPRAFHNKLVRLYPDSRLLAAPMQSRGDMVGYPAGLEQALLAFCRSRITSAMPADTLFECATDLNELASTTRPTTKSTTRPATTQPTAPTTTTPARS
jgi:spore photoproduct lyase